MKTEKKNLLVIASVVMMLLISALSLFISYISGAEMLGRSVPIVIGLVAIGGLCLIKERYLYDASIGIWIFAVGILLVQLIVDDPYESFNRYLNIGSFHLSTSAFLPLVYVPAARIIGKQKKIELKNIGLLCVAVLLPLSLVMAQVNAAPVVIALATCYITLIVMNKEKRINIPWFVFLIPIVLMIAATIYAYFDSTYVSAKLQVILTRGQSEPMGLGWIRTILDGILTDTPLVGATHYSIGLDTTDLVADWGAHNIVLLLTEYGWLPFIGAVAAFAIFFVCIFAMVRKTNQSTFAKYTSLLLAFSLCVCSAYSLLGIFLLDGASTDMPFLSNNTTTQVMSFIMFGIILSLYIQSDKTSAITESGEEELF